jgi:methionine synthase I (cobalamin-dependent)
MLPGLASVITFAAEGNGKTTEGMPIPEALRELEKAGADVVGLNCWRGIPTVMDLMRDCRKVCKVRLVLKIGQVSASSA